jgi:hypothetical protein
MGELKPLADVLNARIDALERAWVTNDMELLRCAEVREVPVLWPEYAEEVESQVEGLRDALRQLADTFKTYAEGQFEERRELMDTMQGTVEQQHDSLQKTLTRFLEGYQQGYQQVLTAFTEALKDYDERVTRLASIVNVARGLVTATDPGEQESLKAELVAKVNEWDAYIRDYWDGRLAQGTESAD